jgi:hypothetical protein
MDLCRLLKALYECSLPRWFGLQGLRLNPALYSIQLTALKKRRLAAPQNRQWYSVNTGIKSTPEN